MNAQVNTYRQKNLELIIDRPERKYVLLVRDRADQPDARSKLISLGVSALDNAELLSLILDPQTSSPLSFSRRLIREYGERSWVHLCDPRQIQKELSISPDAACRLAASLEIGRRLFRSAPKNTAVLRTARQAFSYLRDMRDQPKEQLRGIYLNSRYRVVHDEIISLGTLTANIVHPREVFRPALEHSAAALIIAHNHPSGNLQPTAADLEITERLIQAGKLLDIELLDHLIIAGHKYMSIPADY